MRHVFLSITLFILSNCFLRGQERAMRFDHISIEQGLSDLTVFSIAQDSSGFLWFGTSDGLNKYDGHTFTVFRTDPTDSTSMAPGSTNALCVDHSGTLWIGSGGGLSILPRDSTIPHRLSESMRFGPPESRHVNWLHTLRNGDVAIGTSGGLYFYTRGTNEFIRAHFDTLAPLIVSTLAETDDGILWIGAVGRGLIAFNQATGTTKEFRFDNTSPTMLHGNVVGRVVKDRSGRIWVTTNICLSRFDPASGSFIRYTKERGLAEDDTPDALVDRKGTLWVGTFHQGVARYRPESDDFVRYTHDPEDPQSLTSERLTRMFEDRGGVLWFANYRAGLNRLNAKRSAFTHFVPRRTPGAGLSTEGVYAIMEDSFNDVWIGTYGGGLNRYNPATQRYTYYRRDPTKRFGISSDNVLAIAESRTGDLWIGGGGGLDRFERRTGRFIHYPMVDETKRLGPNREVKSVFEGSDGYIWFGTFEGGLHRLDPETGTMRHYKHPGGDAQTTGSPGIWTICEDARGRLWLGSYGAGLFVMDRERETFKRLVHDEKKPLTTIRSNGIYHIFKDDKGTLWIGTMGGGLTRLDPETETIRNYVVEDGLPNNFVKGIRPDNKGNLWLSTDFGLSKFNPEAGTFENIKAEDGLVGNVFLSGAHHVGRSGRMFFGGEKGAIGFHPDSIEENTFVPPVVITSLRLLDRPYPLHMQRTFSHDINSVAFEFVALDYTLPERNQYAYMMEGVDRSWVRSGTRRYASYPHLDPGTYTFRVRGSNNDGVWNNQGASLTFTITPPYWETWWFRIGVVAVLVAIGTWFYNYRVNRLIDIERLRVKIASDLHDDIGSSLTRISLQSELIQEGIEPKEMSTYLKNIAGTSRELVMTMSDIVWSIDSRNDTIENLVNKIRDFASSALAAQQIDLTFSHSGLDLHRKLPVDKRENVYLVCKEAVNNIAKHSGARTASIIIRNDYDKLSIVIADDGKGWSGEEKLNSHGVKNMKMRAGRLGGTVEFLNDNGARVVLTMKPL